MKDIMKIVKFLEESSLLIKNASEAIKKKAKEQKINFLVCYFQPVNGQIDYRSW